MSRIRISAYTPDCVKNTYDIEDVKIYLKYKKPDGEDYEITFIPEVILVEEKEEELDSENNEEEKKFCANCRFFDYECSPLDGPTGHCARVSSEYYKQRTRVDFTCDDWAVKENK